MSGELKLKFASAHIAPPPQQCFHTGCCFVFSSLEDFVTIWSRWFYHHSLLEATLAFFLARLSGADLEGPASCSPVPGSSAWPALRGRARLFGRRIHWQSVQENRPERVAESCPSFGILLPSRDQMKCPLCSDSWMYRSVWVGPGILFGPKLDIRGPSRTVLALRQPRRTSITSPRLRPTKTEVTKGEAIQTKAVRRKTQSKQLGRQEQSLQEQTQRRKLTERLHLGNSAP